MGKKPPERAGGHHFRARRHGGVTDDPRNGESRPARRRGDRPSECMLGGLQRFRCIGAESGQEDLTSRSASPETFAAARDLAFESLIETGSLAESYARSLTEAAWRGDRSTVEIHLRQLRARVLACIDFFKRLDG